jgi:ribosome maturation factor RimP
VGQLAESPVLARVRELVAPIASDLGLDLYDVEQRGATLRVTLDTPAGSPGGVTLDDLALASRLVSRELDHHDPVPGRYTLEVTSPGVERPLRTPDHFRREVGKVVAIRLSDVGHDERRITGTLVAADDATVTVMVGADERTVRYDQIDRAKTVFEWGPTPKPGSDKRKKKEHSS